MSYLLHLVALIAIYVILAQALNLAFGYGGMLSLCSAAIAGIGAYCSGLLMVRLGLSYFIALPIAAALSGFVAFVVGSLSQRLRGDAFVMATMGVQAIVSAALLNWSNLTGGAAGLPGIPRPAFFSAITPTALGSALFTVATAFGTSLLLSHLMASGYGRALQAVRDDPLAAMALGKRPAYYRATAFAISGVLGGVGGSAWAVHISFIDPASFSLEESVLVLSIVIIGGGGSIGGPILGATLLLLLPEALRFLGVADSVAPNLRQIVYGALLVGVMLFRPQGLAGRYALD
jgi:branched-chain amino acid transport system permease protein